MLDSGKACERIVSADGKQVRTITTELSEAESLVDAEEAVLYQTQDECYDAMKYASDRRNDYPAIEEQLDSLYHEIIVSGSLTSSGSWAQSIRAVKDANPKPE